MVRRLLEAIAVWHHNFGTGYLFPNAPKCADCGRYLGGEGHYPIPLCKRDFDRDPDKAFTRYPRETAEWKRRTLANADGIDNGIWEIVDELKQQAWQEEKTAFALIQRGAISEAIPHQQHARQLLAEAEEKAKEAQQIREYMQQAMRDAAG